MTDDRTGGWWLPDSLEPLRGHRLALRDWAACAVGGGRSSSVRGVDALAAGRGPSRDAFVLAVRSHVLDFDDTYPPGLAHLSSPTAAAALATGAAAGGTVHDVERGHARGFEFMASLSRVHHPALYERGWHPTSVCGAPAAAVAAGTVLGLGDSQIIDAVRIAMLQAGGLQAAFGSAGKALQVGFAAESGVRAALLADAGVTGPARVDVEWPMTFGSTSHANDPDGSGLAILDNWIKAYPCCLQTHTAIEATRELVEGTNGQDVGTVQVVVHPLSLRAAPVVAVRDVLQMKFSIPYLVAFVLAYGRPPGVDDLEEVDPVVVERASRVEVQGDPHLPQSAALVSAESTESFRADAALGSPDRPMTDEHHARKVKVLGAEAIVALADQVDCTAREFLDALLQRER